MPQVCLTVKVIDCALSMELDSELYYRQLAAGVKYEELKVVLEGLAEDEHHHYKIVQTLKKLSPENLEQDPGLGKGAVAHGMDRRKLFLSTDQNSIAKERYEQLDVYRAALRKEEESVQLYQRLLADTDHQAQKNIIGRLIQEEQRHVEVLGNIIQMFNNVNEWVESAEFNHLKSY